MADKNITVEVVTPERLVFSSKTDFVVVPGVEGYIGILPLHAPIVSALATGVMKIITDGKEEKLAISNGLVEVSNDKVVILADSAELSSEIDVERAKAAQERAMERLRNRNAEVDVARAELALNRAVARLKASGKLH